MDSFLHIPGCTVLSVWKDMPRKLTFVLHRTKYEASPVKIDRRKLYGWARIEATDDAGDECEVVSTDETGQLILLPGGTAAGLLSPRGEWVERSELKTVTAEGKPARLLPSSYDTDIVLGTVVARQEYLNHNITDFYELADAPEELIRLVGDDIYTFAYCYTRDCEGSPAFVMRSGDTLFLLVGQRLQFDMAGYDEPGFLGEEEDGEETDELDFAMLQ